MTSTLLVATMVLALGQAQPREITLHGCVTPGLDKGTYALTQVTHIAGPGVSVVPEAAHGRRVFFWLDNDADVRRFPGQMVEVQGRFTDIKESEIDLKAGRQKDGGLVVEFEGPGKDVRVPNAAVEASVGTGGRLETEKGDIKTYLLRIDVRSVKATGTCQ